MSRFAWFSSFLKILLFFVFFFFFYPRSTNIHMKVDWKLWTALCCPGWPHVQAGFLSDSQWLLGETSTKMATECKNSKLIKIHFPHGFLCFFFIFKCLKWKTACNQNQYPLLVCSMYINVKTHIHTHKCTNLQPGSYTRREGTNWRRLLGNSSRHDWLFDHLKAPTGLYAFKKCQKFPTEKWQGIKHEGNKE